MSEEVDLISDNLEVGERMLQNGSRGNLEVMCDQMVHISAATRLLLHRPIVTKDRCEQIRKTDRLEQKSKRHFINWPTAGVIFGILAFLYKAFVE